VTGVPVLAGSHVRLEPLDERHVEGLLEATAGGAALFRWTTIPRDLAGMRAYVATALAARSAGTAEPFATVRVEDDTVIGCTRFFDLERWPWPKDHAEARRAGPDACEIGYTWLAPLAVRTAANTEAKLLMLSHAFTAWQVRRVCFHTDVRNERSRNALLGIGARFEGVLYSHRISSELKPRDSARYSIVAADWPEVRERLSRRLAEHAADPGVSG
jgi:RimJ/RimL family protein N-acetyltransferase